MTQRGEVYEIDVPRGAGPHLCVVVQSDVAIARFATVLLVPLSDAGKHRGEPFSPFISRANNRFLTKDTVAVARWVFFFEKKLLKPAKLRAVLHADDLLAIELTLRDLLGP